MANFLDPYITYAVGVLAARKHETKIGESYTPITSYSVAMELRNLLPNRTDITRKSMSSYLGRLASDPASPIKRSGAGTFGDRHYDLIDGAFPYEQVGCARCHGEGHKLVFMPLDNPIRQVRAGEDGKAVIQGGHWAMCPKVHQPIIFGVIVKAEAEDA